MMVEVVMVLAMGTMMIVMMVEVAIIVLDVRGVMMGIIIIINNYQHYH